jgi:diguanylate cyclase (GGDEF)-like protein
MRSRPEHIGHTLSDLQQGSGSNQLDEFIHLVESGQAISKEDIQVIHAFSGSQDLSRIVDIRAVKLGDGFAMTWRDVTERRKTELAEREQRILAEALSDSTAALNSTLHLNEVFDRILVNVGKVVPHENANIMLVEDGVTRVVGSLGYTQPALEALLTIRLPVAGTATFRRMSDTGEPVIVSDTRDQANWIDVPETRWIRSYAGAPIRVKEKTVGFINLNATVPGHFKDTHVKRLQAFAHQAGVAVENAQLYAQTQQLAITDELTGIYNRRGLFELGRREVERSLRFGHPLSALMLDIDKFKDVNDNYGHKIGDQVLQQMAARCMVNIREIDIFGRYGGEEFVILLPESPAEDAGQVAERLRGLIGDEPFQTTMGAITITISLGVAGVNQTGEDLNTLIERADRALYIAKQSGRNKVALV